jgi:hypothetical protein
MSETYTVKNASVVRKSEKAILVRSPELEEDIWVPQSQIDDDSEVWKPGTRGDLIVSGWFATQKGWL